ncbi:MAG: alcohol dehydrogenase [Gammaproteobacteria bacterium]|nr:alcohol dehydrogenase [Gammaproteobacteria bacterium]
MQAAVFKGIGSPLSIETRPDPVPGAGEVVLRVGRCGVCGTDLSMTDGSGQTYKPDSVIGHEFAGEVVAMGHGVTRFKAGDYATAMPYTGCGSCATCLAGRPNFCAEFRGAAGGFAQYVTASERVAVKLPATLTLADGALIEPLAVSLHGAALAHFAPGARVLVIGAGPIGLGATFWARRLGAGPIAVTATTRRAESLATQMGASVFVHPDSAQDLPRAAAAALGGMPDVVIEAVGKPDLIAQAVNCVRPAGTVVVLGFCSVPDSFVPAIAVWKEVKLQFSMTYSVQEFEHVARVLDSGDVQCRAMITDTVPLAALPETFEALRHRSTQCKVMVSPWS